MSINRNFLSIEEFKSQGTTGAVVMSIARFHEKTAQELELKNFRPEVIQDHIDVAYLIRKMAYKMDPTLDEQAKKRHDRSKNVNKNKKTNKEN